ncbi:hypothetical protein IDH44_18750 [Paenibacillus sp. IB182496]|uniref:Rhamnogalacturonase A/B/Epimerase-like pectate lyase domain-containing protein n=2 Tax=Paenibacillus sabuli TaxID=2772509 RepID=A0A927BUU5_9BACL|nr:hypothetical protein [Paenibacillus sabuli]
MAEIEIPGDGAVPAGTYTVELANDGVHYRPLEEDVTLTIVPAGSDPLGLGVAWSYAFDWGTQLDATAYGADGSDGLDDTAAIQATIDAVDALGGGTVYLPEGNYRISRLELPEEIVLLGDGQEETVLTYVPLATATTAELESWTVIRSVSNDGGQGLARLTLTMDDAASDLPLPNQFLWLGNGWNPDYSSQQTAERIFLKEFALDYRMEEGPWSRSGTPGYIAIEALAHVLIADSEFRGFAPGPTSSYIYNYAQLLDNEFDTTAGNTYVTGSYITVIGNEITRSLPSVDEGKQGIFVRGPAYVAGNSIANTGSESANDGEIVSAENFRGGLKMMGTVAAAGADSVTVAPKRDNGGAILGANGLTAWTLERRAWGEWHIVIVDGRGMGQYRALTAYLGDETYQVAQPWDILPDATSKFAIVLANKMVTMTDNVGLNNGNTFQLYGDSIDAVMAGNAQTDSEGFYAHSIYLERPERSDSRFSLAYFTRIEDNTVTGVSWRSNVGTISIHALNETHDPFAYLIYGADIRDNELTGISDSSRLRDRNYYNGIAVGSLHNAVKPTRPAVKAVVIADNAIADTDRGITIGAPGPQYDSNTGYMTSRHDSAVTGVVVEDNTFDNVDLEIDNSYGSSNVTILP